MISTIFGSRGFVGRHLAATLCSRGKHVWLPERGDLEVFNRPLGVVYYCIGLTADFRSRPYDTIDAHIGVLRKLLELADFEQLVYLSSTRVYAGSLTAQESQPLTIATFRPDDLYNISKLMGESLALTSNRNCSVARLSNVLGFDMGDANFLGTLLAGAKKNGSVNLYTSLQSEKDYVWIDDVVEGLIAISEKGQSSIYNIAGGQNVFHGLIANLFATNGIKVTVAENAVTTNFPLIDIGKIYLETGFQPHSIEPRLIELIKTVA